MPTKLFTQETKVQLTRQGVDKTSLNVSPEARTRDILCEPSRKQNQQLTTGSSAVYQRIISWTKTALSSLLPNSRRMLLHRCKTFSCSACPGTCKIQNLDSPQADGWGGARQGSGAWHGWKVWDAGKLIRHKDKPPFCLPMNRRDFPECLLGITLILTMQRLFTSNSISSFPS